MRWQDKEQQKHHKTPTRGGVHPRTVSLKQQEMSPSILPLTEHHSIPQSPQSKAIPACWQLEMLMGICCISRQRKRCSQLSQVLLVKPEVFSGNVTKERKKKWVLRPCQAGSSSPGKVLCPFLTPTPNASFAQEISFAIQVMSRQPSSLQRWKSPLPPNFHWEGSSWYLKSRDLTNMQREELQTAPFSQQQANGTCRKQRQVLPSYFKMVISKPRLKNGHEAYYEQSESSLLEI